MKNLTKVATLFLITAFLASPLALAKKDGNPFGWTKGEKKGWDGGEVPPGWSKKDQKAAEKEAKKLKKYGVDVTNVELGNDLL